MFGLLLILLALVTLASCSGDGGEGNNEALGDSAPLSSEETDSVTIRVSGTEGTAFLGDYGSFTAELQAIDGTLEAEPADYEVGGDFS